MPRWVFILPAEQAVLVEIHGFLFVKIITADLGTKHH